MDFSYLDDWTEEEVGEVLEEVGEGYRHIWVLAETEGGALLPATFEAMGQARDLADQIGVYVYGVLLGHQVEPLGQELAAYGADRVLVIDDALLAEYQPGLYTQAVADLVERYHPEIVLLPATPLGHDLAPRLAQRLDTGLISRCTELGIEFTERLLVGTTPVFGGEMHHILTCPQARPQIATLQPGSFRIPYQDAYRSAEVQLVDADLGDLPDRLDWIDLAAPVDLPDVPLSKAKIVVAAGRGMGDAEGFALVEQLANALGGAVAGSRGAFDEGWIAEGQIVGVGGEFVTPDLYVACGISGDIYHSFGLRNAKFIIAINPDEEAPINKLANMAIIGDARQIISAWLDALAS